jgi:hypothetical protein
MSANGNVISLPGVRAPSAAPNTTLIAALRETLERAESGEPQSFIGTGFTGAGMRFAFWCDHHTNVYEMLGAIAWLQAEYVHRHEEAAE